MSHTLYCTYALLYVLVQIAELMLSQCKKRDLHYKMASIEATGSVLDSLKTDVFSDFFEIILPSIKPVIPKLIQYFVLAPFNILLT